VPKEGFENKKIYIWAENVLGYLSDCYLYCQQRELDFYEFWNSAKQYYVHGKDNIPFHTIILPSLLLARKDVKFHLPDEIISSEYLTLEGRKISTSRNWAIWAKDIISRYNADSIRYFLITNGPEKRDTDFSWREFINSHNGELLGAYGNFVNRNLAFVSKYFEGKVPEGILNDEIKSKIENLYSSTGSNIESGNFKTAIDDLFEFVRYSNKYFDTEEPWKTRNSNVEACKTTIFNCIQIISNLAVLLKPFLPFSSEKIQSWLNLSDTWQPQYVEIGFTIGETGILFERIDKKVVDEEVEKLGFGN
jgi:methionyl-tRNA synthetase